MTVKRTLRAIIILFYFVTVYRYVDVDLNGDKL